jgi:hypothetical protein
MPRIAGRLLAPKPLVGRRCAADDPKLIVRRRDGSWIPPTAASWPGAAPPVDHAPDLPGLLHADALVRYVPLSPAPARPMVRAQRASPKVSVAVPPSRVRLESRRGSACRCTGIGCLSPNGNGRRRSRGPARRQSGVGGSRFDPEGADDDRRGARVRAGGPPRPRTPGTSRGRCRWRSRLAEALSDAGIDAASLTLSQRRELGVVLGRAEARSSFPSGCTTSTTPTRSRRRRFIDRLRHHRHSLLRDLDAVQPARPSHVVSTGCASSTDASVRLPLDQVRDGRRPALGRVDATVVRGIMEGSS